MPSMSLQSVTAIIILNVDDGSGTYGSIPCLIHMPSFVERIIEY
jgi:hypothetical protein